MKRIAPTGIIDHIEIPVSQFDPAQRFYRAVLGTLGLEEIIKVRSAADDAFRAGFGMGGYPRLWIVEPREPSAQIHLAFRAERRDDVDKFYYAALQSGGLDNGKPDIRARYHQSYYAAYVFDPDGNNIEAVCQQVP